VILRNFTIDKSNRHQLPEANSVLKCLRNYKDFDFPVRLGRTRGWRRPWHWNSSLIAVRFTEKLRASARSSTPIGSWWLRTAVQQHAGSRVIPRFWSWRTWCWPCLRQHDQCGLRCHVSAYQARPQWTRLPQSGGKHLALSINDITMRTDHRGR